jgi:hypothetical protein
MIDPTLVQAVLLVTIVLAVAAWWHGYVAEASYLPTRWDRYVPRLLWIPWVVVKTYLVVAGAFALLMYLLHRAGLPSLWPT